MPKLGKVIGILITGLIIISGFYPYSLSQAQGDSYSIEVDETSKSVYFGEDAVFKWYLENNEQHDIYEIYPSANSNRSRFEPNSIILNPGERGIMIQLFNTTGLNSSFVDVISVTWLIKLSGPFNIVKNPLNPSQSCSVSLELNILENETLNDTNEIINNTNEISNEFESELNLSSLLLIGIIIFVALPLSYFTFKKRKFRN